LAFVLWLELDGQLTDFLRWPTRTHTEGCHAHCHTIGTGHLYQVRLKAFATQEDEHFLTPKAEL